MADTATLDARDGLLNDNDALFLDFDGTLAGLQDDPAKVYLVDGLDQVLLALSQRLSGALAILSGRGLSDLCSRVPGELWRFGNHGLYAAEPGDPGPDAPPPSPAVLIAGLEAAAAPFERVWVEPKGPVIAVHYRAAPQSGEALGLALKHQVAALPGYKLQHGKLVYEIKPERANKGVCIDTAMQSAPFAGRRAVMIGDDTTDEDAFEVALKLGGVAIKVGEGVTCASHRLSGVDAVHSLLKHRV